MDKSLAKRTNKVLFVKVENDGFDLGAQRRPIDKNDLPKALEFIRNTKTALVSGKEIENTDFAHLVEKTKISESGDWNLSGERYIVGATSLISKFELFRFNDVCTLEYGASLPKRNRKPGDYPVVGSNGITGWHNEYLIEAPAIVVGRKGSAGEVVFINKPCFPIDTTYYVKPLHKEKIDMKFLYFVVKELNLPALKNGAGIPGLNRNDVYDKRKIPLPPLDIQKAIVEEIEDYQKIIDGARQVVDNYKPTIKIDPEWEMVELKDTCINPRSDIVDGPFGSNLKASEYVDNGLPIIRLQNIERYNFIDKNIKYVTLEKADQLKRHSFGKGDIIISKLGDPLGKACIIPDEFEWGIIVADVVRIRVDENIASKHFIELVLNSDTVISQLNNLKKGATRPRINLSHIRSLKIPFPSIHIQKETVTKIKVEQKIVNSNKKLINIYEQKIKDRIAEVWGD
jgi:type I restriction enzyme M protein